MIFCDPDVADRGIFGADHVPLLNLLNAFILFCNV